MGEGSINDGAIQSFVDQVLALFGVSESIFGMLTLIIVAFAVQSFHVHCTELVGCKPAAPLRRMRPAADCSRRLWAATGIPGAAAAC